MPAADDILDAIGHATRRLILEALSSGPLPVGVLADRLPISRPAVSQHLKVLKDADLVTETTVGTRHHYGLNPAGLTTVRAYLDQMWAGTLDNFATLARAEADRLAPPHSARLQEGS